MKLGPFHLSSQFHTCYAKSCKDLFLLDPALLWGSCELFFFFSGFNTKLALTLEPEVKRGIWPFSPILRGLPQKWQSMARLKWLKRPGWIPPDHGHLHHISWHSNWGHDWNELTMMVWSVICWWSFGLPSKESSGRIAQRRGTRTQDAICRLKLLQVLHWMISSRRCECLSVWDANKRHLCCYIIEKPNCRPLPKPKGTNSTNRCSSHVFRDARWPPWQLWMLSKNPKEIWRNGETLPNWVQVVWVVRNEVTGWHPADVSSVMCGYEMSQVNRLYCQCIWMLFISVAASPNCHFLRIKSTLRRWWPWGIWFSVTWIKLARLLGHRQGAKWEKTQRKQCLDDA